MISKLLTLQQTADILGVSYARAADLARKGNLGGVVHLGRQVRVNTDDLERFLRDGGRSLAGNWRHRES